jgi:hypothetical protein
LDKIRALSLWGGCMNPNHVRVIQAAQGFGLASEAEPVLWVMNRGEDLERVGAARLLVAHFPDLTEGTGT